MRLCMEAMDGGAIMTKSHVICCSPQTNERTNNKQEGNRSLALPLWLINSSSWLFFSCFMSTIVAQGWRAPNFLIIPSINWFLFSKAYFMHLFWPLLLLVVNCFVICFSTQTFNCAILLDATKWQLCESRTEQLIDFICVFLHTQKYTIL